MLPFMSAPRILNPSGFLGFCTVRNVPEKTAATFLAAEFLAVTFSYCSTIYIMYVLSQCKASYNSSESLGMYGLFSATLS